MTIDGTTKRLFFTIICVLCVISMIAIAFAVPNAESKLDQKLPVVTVPINQTFSSCVDTAVKIRTDCFSISKTQQKSCLETIKGSNTSNALGKACNVQLRAEYNTCKSTFRSSKSECSKLPHTPWEGFFSYFK